jgi:hypothetical protein
MTGTRHDGSGSAKSGTQTFAYDSLSRLTRGDSPATWDYAFDNYGNIRASPPTARR